MDKDIIITTITGKSGPNQTLENCHSLVVDIIEGIAEVTSSGRKITDFKLEITHVPMDKEEAPQRVSGTIYHDGDKDVYILDEVENALEDAIQRIALRRREINNTKIPLIRILDANVGIPRSISDGGREDLKYMCTRILYGLTCNAMSEEDDRSKVMDIRAINREFEAINLPYRIRMTGKSEVTLVKEFIEPEDDHE